MEAKTITVSLWHVLYAIPVLWTAFIAFSYRHNLCSWVKENRRMCISIGGFAASIISLLALAFSGDRTAVGKYMQEWFESEATSQQDMDEYYETVLPGPWRQFFDDVADLRYLDTRIAAMRSFVGRKDIPPLPPKGHEIFCDLMKHSSDTRWQEKTSEILAPCVGEFRRGNGVVVDALGNLQTSPSCFTCTNHSPAHVGEDKLSMIANGCTWMVASDNVSIKLATAPQSSQGETK